MKNYNYFLLFAFLFINANVYGQDSNDKELIVRKDFLFTTKYFHQGKAYEQQQLPKVLITDPIAWNIYQQYQSNRRKQRTFWVFAGALVTSSVIIAYYDDESPDLIESLMTNKWTKATALGSVGAATAAVVFSILKNYKFEKSIQVFNKNVSTAPLQLNLQYSENGMGLVLNF